jgi:microcystin-dependent protein
MMAFTTFTSGTLAKSSEVNENFTNSRDDLGEIKAFALSVSGAVTKASLQGRGWAICDGTTPADQGIASATITTTPDLREKFLRHSANETTGGTGGLSEVTLTEAQMPAHTHTYHRWPTGTGGWGTGSGMASSTISNTGSTGNGEAHENKPPYYDICYFIKVKIV